MTETQLKTEQVQNEFSLWMGVKATGRPFSERMAHETVEKIYEYVQHWYEYEARNALNAQTGTQVVQQ